MVLWPVSTKPRTGLASWSRRIHLLDAGGARIRLLVVLSIKALVGPWPTFVDAISTGLRQL
jgi:hypothetical protein